VRSLAARNYSITPSDDGKWLLHNHDRATSTLSTPLSLEEIIQFFQIDGEDNGQSGNARSRSQGVGDAAA
jgi:hypothetical protein